jgi:hypothetical protein
MEVGTALDAPPDKEPCKEAYSGRHPILPDELEVGVPHTSKDAEFVEVGGAQGVVTFGTERERASVWRAAELDAVEHELKRAPLSSGGDGEARHQAIIEPAGDHLANRGTRRRAMGEQLGHRRCKRACRRTSVHPESGAGSVAEPNP